MYFLYWIPYSCITGLVVDDEAQSSKLKAQSSKLKGKYKCDGLPTHSFFCHLSSAFRLPAFAFSFQL